MKEDRAAILAPAKVNLFLEVLARRPDGFHEIDTVFQAVSLCDRLTCEAAEHLELDVRGAGAEVPRDERNLVLRAARALAVHAGVRRGARITLEKEIPVGAGLGGGSSDAAAALRALDRMWGTSLGEDDLLALASGLGSDVPFFVRGGTARGRGRGERLEPISTEALFWHVIVWPGVPISTAEAYRRLDEHRQLTRQSPERLVRALERGDVAAAGAATFNRLEEVAKEVRPELGRTLDLLREAGAIASHVTGSGSAVFGLFDRESVAEQVAGYLRTRIDDSVWVAHTLERGAATWKSPKSKSN